MTEEQQKLVEENHNLIYSFLQRYNLSIDEFYGLAAIGLCKAAMSYREDKACFSTYAYRCMFTAVLCEIRKNNAEKAIPKNMTFYYQEEITNAQGDTTSFIDYMGTEDSAGSYALAEIIFEEYVNKLKSKPRSVLLLSVKGFSQKEISEITGYSPSHVSRILKKFHSYVTSH